MKNTDEKKKFIISFSIIALCAVIICFTIGITVAWYIDYKKEDVTLNLGKVELGASTVYETSLSLDDVIAGTEILSQPLKVSKMSDSVPIYIRAKLSFSIHPKYYKNNMNADDVATLEFLEKYIAKVKKDTEFNFYRKAQGSGDNTATWSYKYGNYVYLIYSKKDALDANGKPQNGNNVNNERMFLVSDTTEFILTKSITMPMTIDQDPLRTQFGKSIIFHFAFQAIQAVELDKYDFTSLVSIFNSSFPEPDEQASNYEEESLDSRLERKYLLSSNLADSQNSVALTSSGQVDFVDNAYITNNKKLTTNVSVYFKRNVFSVSFWAKLPTANYSAGADLFSFEIIDKEEYTRTISFETVDDTGTLLDIKGGNIASEGVKQVATSKTEFVHYVVIADGERFEIYVNGERVGYMTYLEDGWSLTGNFNLGDTGMYAHVKDFRIYTTVISDYQIAEVYNGN